MLVPTPISREGYAPFGDLVEVHGGLSSTPANQGTATRYRRVARLANLRVGRAEPELSIFRCRPPTGEPLRLALLERHPLATQVFLPMTSDAEFLAVVCAGAERPDLQSLRVFTVRSPTGISYRPGIWHHPMIVLHRPADFACLGFEDGSEADCEEFELPAPVQVALPELA